MDTHDQASEPSNEEGEDMAHGNTYLGEFTTAPVVYPPKDNSGLAMVLAAGIIASGLALGAYLLANQPGQAATDTDTDTNTTYKVEKWTPDQ